MTRNLPPSALLVLAPFLLGGCLLVRSTEHRVRLNADGSGDALLRLIDIRSDGETDSAVAGDFTLLMGSYDDSTLSSFEDGNRKVIRRQLITSGDTLTAEVAYTFTSLEAVEGLRVTEDEIAVLVDPTREIVRTNGSREPLESGGVRIVWDRDAARLHFEIRERSLPPSVLLGPFHRRVPR